MTNELIQKNDTMTTLPIPVSSFENYIQAVKSITVLSREQESQLAKDFLEKDDLQAAEKLIMSHLRYVVFIARGYSGYGLPLADLVQEGNVGLMKSVKRFDPSVGVRLISFAVHWIRAEIHEFILKNWRIVKVATTKAQRKLFFNLRSKKKRMAWLNHSEVHKIAKDLGVKPETVVEMESRLTGSDISFDPATNDDNDEKSYQSPAGYLKNLSNDPAKEVENTNLALFNQERLNAALNSLDERSQDILRQRWLNEDKSTLQTIGNQYNVSAERIRQLENNAMSKIRKLLET